MRIGIITFSIDKGSSISEDYFDAIGQRIHDQCLHGGTSECKQALADLRYNLFSLPDKQQIWDDIIILANIKDGNISRDASSVLFSALSLVPDKQQAWDDLLGLLNSEFSYTKRSATSALGFSFFQLQDKEQQWNILHELAKNPDVDIKQGIASSLSFVFSQLQDKHQPWNDLHELTEDNDLEVRRRAVISLGIVFHLLEEQDKHQSLDDLHRLISDDALVRKEVAIVLGFVFPLIPNKKLAYADLIVMADEELEEDEDVKAQANYSLGRVSIFYASKAKDDEEYKVKFDNAIKYFEKAAQKSPYDWLNPSRFCLPFYRSFYAVIFAKQENKEDIKKYLDEAKDALDASGNKRLLIDIIEHLSIALDEVQHIGRLNLHEKRKKLRNYKKHCEMALELMRSTEKKAPFLTKVIQRGLPILDKNIKNLIEEIQKTSKDVCKESTGVARELACTINKEIRKRETDYELEVKQFIEDAANSLEGKIIDIAENKYLLEKISLMRSEIDLEKQLNMLLYVVSNLNTIRVVSESELEKLLNKKLENFEVKLNNVSFNVRKIGMNSYNNIILVLNGIESELKNMKNTISSLEVSSSKLNEKLDELNNTLQKNSDELKESISSLPQNEDTENILKMLDELKKLQNNVHSTELPIEKLKCALTSIQIMLGAVNLAHRLNLIG